MKDLYQVKFEHDGKTIYGIVDRYSKEARKLPKSKRCLVEDAILPKTYVVDEKRLISLPTDFGGEYDKYVEGQLKAAQKLSDSVKGFEPGKLFALGVADGSAWYVVTKVKGKNATVEWRGFCMDRWTDRWLGWGGTFPCSQIKPLVKAEEGMRKLFGGKEMVER
jgi:hypothetical protein